MIKLNDDGTHEPLKDIRNSAMKTIDLMEVSKQYTFSTEHSALFFGAAMSLSKKHNRPIITVSQRNSRLFVTKVEDV